MAQVSTDAQGTPAKPAPGANRPMPLSPHLQVWRWHITMAGSIAHRATGVALYGAALLAAGWALALALGPDAYDAYAGFLASWLGLLILFGITVSIFYHLASGLRHLYWDTARGLEPRTANMLTVACFACAIVFSLVLWVGAFALGAPQ